MISRSTAPTLHSNLNGNGHVRQGSHSSQARASLDGLGLHSVPIAREVSSASEREMSDEYDGDDAHHDSDGAAEERKMKAEAKSNRKVRLV